LTFFWAICTTVPRFE